MRYFAGLILLACASCLYAQTAEESSEVAAAKAEIKKLQALFDAGAIPRAQLDKAEAALADAEDAAYLRHTLYGADLTEDQSGDMLAAARRRVDRRKSALDDARKLVDSGVASLLSLTDYIEEFDRARKEYDLAESRAHFTAELTRMAQAEQLLEDKLASQPEEARELADRYEGDGAFSLVTFARVENDFEKQFGHALPISAMGDTAVHRSLGFDHRGRVDVAIHPDQPEGRWLLEYLVDHHIPYFAFRHAVPGKATGAHIHIGPMSTRVKLGG
jgi:hypothetical protein